MRHAVLAGLGALAGILGVASAIGAQTFSSGSTGAHGALNPASSLTLDLPDDGVFHFTTVTIPAGVTLRFNRNAANTGVALLARGPVTIAGTIDISGAPGGGAVAAPNVIPNFGAGGPGGFDGGSGATGFLTPTAGAGLGPGGGASGFAATVNAANGGGGGGFGMSGSDGSGPGTTPQPTPGGPSYGSALLLPLIGGSGGGGGGPVSGKTGGGGGGGGGAILIASSELITLTGKIMAQGGAGGAGVATSCLTPIPGAGGGGSGGAVRLVAPTINGSGGEINVTGGAGVNGCQQPGLAVHTHSGPGGSGRIRVETSTNALLSLSASANPSFDVPGFITLPSGPALTISSVSGIPAPTSPRGSFASPDLTLPAGTPNPVAVTLTAQHIPPGTTVQVTVKAYSGALVSVTSSALSGTAESSTASASVTIPSDQPSIISAVATFPLVATAGQGPIVADAEAGPAVTVSASWGTASRVSYGTRSGRQLAIGGGR